ncbi:methyltransferase domain-containing protein [Streptomyces sp. SID2563]|uniref:class I SAM-dependent methyltransferase n=1 Tax=Streptomyces sp. SID2563 TaxID=2690255 RepID=UPI001369AAC6|nr:class I SAM-dependent methyltransferase [Streptomyces sp. SID2563]MYW10064.1 methyltransferase domain-containing protein [Streptomyces sp. SID2563]
MLDYNQEATVYDATRGGLPRAEAAAAAVLGLVPDTARSLLDIGCGTGLVTGQIAAARPGLRVTGSDAAHGMAVVARERVGAVVLADARRLPLPDAAVDAVSAVWLLHLLREPGAVRAVVAEAARVLRPGGVFVTTVDKDAAHDVGSDIDATFAPYLAPTPADGTDLVVAHAAEGGLDVAGDAFFTGHGQGRSPLSAARGVRRGYYASRLVLPGDAAEQLVRSLAALPDQDRGRADPEYRLLAFRRG